MLRLAANLPSPSDPAPPYLSKASNAIKHEFALLFNHTPLVGGFGFVGGGQFFLPLLFLLSRFPD